jgi:hypothetical protein
MSETVTVACKLPHGLVLRLHEQVETPEPLPGGGTKKVKVWRPINMAPVVLKGYLDRYNPGNAPVSKGSSFALTEGVDKDFFDAWLKQNHDHDAVANGLIFAANNSDTLNGLVKDFAGTRSGLEPIDPDKLPKRISSYKKDDQAAA